jgi:hypothetical protein
MTQKKHIVYLTTNGINGKVYVGVHSSSQHSDGYIGCGVYSYKSALKCQERGVTSPFVNAVVKYGYDAFTRNTLHEFASKEECLVKERELVNKQWVKSNKNYNAIIGGVSDGWKYFNPKPVYRYNFEGLFIKCYASTLDVLIDLGISDTRQIGTLYNCANTINKRQRTWKGSQWSFTKLGSMPCIPRPRTLKRSVVRLGSSGDVVKVYNKVGDVESDGFDPSTVSKVCKGKLKSSFGVKFIYLDEDIVRYPDESLGD